MKIHEYQGKAVLAQYGVPVPKGKVAYTVDEAVEAAKGLGFPVVVKAQIHAGGRGKGGGVKLAKNLDECEAIAQAMLGMTLRTHQTGPEGRVVRRVLVEQGMDPPAEGAVPRRSSSTAPRGRPVFMASAAGGMDIEEVAAKDPEAILKESVDPAWASAPTRRASWPSASASRPDVGQQGRRPSCCPLPGLRGARTPRSPRSTPSWSRGRETSWPSTPR